MSNQNVHMFLGRNKKNMYLVTLFIWSSVRALVELDTFSNIWCLFVKWIVKAVIRAQLFKANDVVT